MTIHPTSIFSYPDHHTPLLKSNRNLFCNVNRWYLFSMSRFEIFHVAWWGLLHLFRKISWVYVIASCLWEHSNLVRFEKRLAKTPQRVFKYGSILMLCDKINTYEWFFCSNWYELCSSTKLLDFTFIYCFLVKYAIQISNMNELLSHPRLCWYATSGNQLIMGNAQQHSDINFLNTMR